MTGCKKQNTEESKSTKTVTKEYDLFIYNSDTSIGTSFRKLCDEYTERTGVKIRTVTPSESDNNINNLENYMNSEYPPDIFPVCNMQELKKFQNRENIWDFSNATESSFKNLVNNIPENLRLSSNTSDSFGIPVTLSGFGLVVDPKMISSLFGGDKYRIVMNDLQLCSYDEFKIFVDALYNYIYNNEIVEFTLNEKNYSFVDTKSDLSKKLTGVFSVPCGDIKYSGSYLMNPVLSSLFSTAAHSYISGDSISEQLSNALMRYSDMLELITLNISGDNTLLSRGDELISNNKNSNSQAIKRFMSGKSLFLLASTEDYNSMNIFDSLVAKRCMFMPIKIPNSEYDISTSDSNLKNKINKSISIYSPRYYCINAKSSDKEKKAAQEFLVWFKTSDLANKYVIPEFEYVPYDITDGSVIDNSLKRSLIEYLSENKFLPGVFYGAPDNWCDTMGKYIIDNMFKKSLWTLQDFEDFANYGVDNWVKSQNNN